MSCDSYGGTSLTIGDKGFSEDPSRFAIRNTKRYRIGEVAELLGMSAESIRYYEREGIIMPERNPISGYRYYSAWDFNMLVRARAYRQQGFSMAEVCEIMRQFNPTSTIDALKEKEAELKVEIAEKLRLISQIKDDQTILKDALGDYQRIGFEYRPAMHFLQTQIGYDMIVSRKPMLGDWIQKYAAFILPGGIYKGPGKNDVAYGMFVEDSKLADVNFKNEEEVEALPSTYCLASSFLSGSDRELKYESFDFALRYIEEHELEIVGEPVSRIVTMARTETSTYRSLHKLWIPIAGVQESSASEPDRFDDMVAKLLSER